MCVYIFFKSLKNKSLTKIGNCYNNICEISSWPAILIYVRLKLNIGVHADRLIKNVILSAVIYKKLNKIFRWRTKEWFQRSASPFYNLFVYCVLKPVLISCPSSLSVFFLLLLSFCCFCLHSPITILSLYRPHLP